MYYRIIVNLNSEKLFRTSRLHTKDAVVKAWAVIKRDLTIDPKLTPVVDVQILEVNDEGQGHILDADAVSSLMADWAIDTGYAGTAEIKAALNPQAAPEA